MARTKLVLELGTGVDMHGNDYTKSAKKAVNDAIRHASLLYIGEVMKAGKLLKMYVDVTVASPKPEAVNTSEVLKELPYGEKTIKVVQGGMQIGETDGIVLSNAAVVVTLDV